MGSSRPIAGARRLDRGRLAFAQGIAYVLCHLQSHKVARHETRSHIPDSGNPDDSRSGSRAESEAAHAEQVGVDRDRTRPACTSQWSPCLAGRRDRESAARGDTMRVKQNAPKNGDAQVDQAGRLGATGQSKVFDCSSDHISNLVQELRDNGLALASTSGQAQTATLRRALAYLGPRGLGTYEGAAAGYPRLAARINDLRSAGWCIVSRRENVIGPDGLLHEQVARYILVSKDAQQGGAPC